MFFLFVFFNLCLSWCYGWWVVWLKCGTRSFRLQVYRQVFNQLLQQPTDNNDQTQTMGGGKKQGSSAPECRITQVGTIKGRIDNETQLCIIHRDRKRWEVNDRKKKLETTKGKMRRSKWTGVDLCPPCTLRQLGSGSSHLGPQVEAKGGRKLMAHEVE